jgi:hypothetical protein
VGQLQQQLDGVHDLRFRPVAARALVGVLEEAEVEVGKVKEQDSLAQPLVDPGEQFPSVGASVSSEGRMWCAPIPSAGSEARSGGRTRL